MTTRTAVNHFNRLSTRQGDILSAARTYKTGHAALISRVKSEIWEDGGYKRSPAWVRDQLAANLEMQIKETYRHFVRWAFETPRGVVLWDDMTESERAAYREPGKSGNHYWLDIKITVAGSVETTVATLTNKTF